MCSDDMFRPPSIGEWIYMCAEHVLVEWPDGIVPDDCFDPGEGDYDEDEEFDEDEDDTPDTDELWIS